MAHSYWRINITATGGGFATARSIKMYDAGGSSLCSGGTATASSHNDAGQDAPSAFDSSDATEWYSLSATSWIRYQFASPVDVATVWYMWGENPNEGPTAFTVQYSDDGSSWTTAASFSGVSWMNITSNTLGGRSFAVAAPGAGYYLSYRVNVTATTSGNPVISAFEMATTSGGSNIASGNGSEAGAGGIYAKDDDGLNYALFGFDGGDSTNWIANSSPSWLSYNFKTPQNIVEFKIRNHSSVTTGSPTAFDFEASIDGGVTWVTLSSRSGVTWPSAGFTRTFDAIASAPTFQAVWAARSNQIIGANNV